MARPNHPGTLSVHALTRIHQLLGGDRTAWRRYGVAVATTSLVLFAWLGIDLLVHFRLHLLLLVAVTISAWYGGRGPGVLASILSLIVIVLPIGRADPTALDVRGVGEVAYVTTFLLVALIIGATTESLRRERAQAIHRAMALEELNTEVEAQMEEVQTLSEQLQETNDSLSDALAYSQDVASRGMRLQEATAALAKAQTENEVADVVLGKGLAAVGAARGFLARVDGDRVEILRAWGYAREVEARLLGPTTDLPLLVRAVETGDPIWVRSVEEHRALYQQLYDNLGIAVVPHASASIPLRHGEEILGALALFFVEPAAVGGAAEAFSLLLAQAAADALARARGYDAERAARQQAETVAQARADVLGVVAHDLRNPLHLIASSTSFLLQDDDISLAHRRKLIEVGQRAVGRMNRLIGDLLDATRLQAGRLTLDLRDVDARALLREAEETLRAVAEQSRVDLRAEPPERESFLRADEGRLLQVIGNLVGNALKFTAAGGCVVLSARPDDDEVVFTVADNGPGIPPEHLEHVFDRFWQARNGDRRGVGLGLAIAKGIVEAHGGRVWVESAVGLGSTFSFAIPSARANAVQVLPVPLNVSS
jgi:signal transduction histidine kinase